MFLRIITLILILAHGALYATTIEQQRRDYALATKALDSRQYQRFERLESNLRTYPLYPYLRYKYIKANIRHIDHHQIVDFLNKHADLPDAQRLEHIWLTQLARTGQWQKFLQNYKNDSDKTALRCLYLRARIQTKTFQGLAEELIQTWKSGKSLPSECDFAFSWLYRHGTLTSSDVWERIGLAMAQNQFGLAKYLQRYLKNSAYLSYAKFWLHLKNNPTESTFNKRLDDNPVARMILLDGLNRLANKDLNRAVKIYNKLSAQYQFKPEETLALRRTMAIRAVVKRKYKLAPELLSRIEVGDLDESLLHYRIRFALSQKNWQLLKAWTEGRAAEESLDIRMRYWHGRALMNTGQKSEAMQIFSELAKKRDYYGFLAADWVSQPYQMQYTPSIDAPAILQEIKAKPAMARVEEFYHLKQNYPARREWQHALKQMNLTQLQAAAVFAYNKGWYDRAIFALIAAKAHDDLVLRFPLAFNQLVNHYASQYHIDQSWMYGLVRSESAFIEDVRSPAGALGLMQVMPKTGSMVAKKLGVRNFKTNDLKQAEKNVPIGSAYMKQVLEQYNGDIVLATASYNAGPHRVKTWLKVRHCMAPDVWIEQIPFTETRHYVRRVLFFSSIYDWRRDQNALISDRMRPILAKNNICPKIDWISQP